MSLGDVKSVQRGNMLKPFDSKMKKLYFCGRTHLGEGDANAHL